MQVFTPFRLALLLLVCCPLFSLAQEVDSVYLAKVSGDYGGRVKTLELRNEKLG
jgi:hypothetical protein